MQVLLWLLIPLAGLIVAAGWVMWRSRPKRTPDAAEGMAEMYRIRQAMSQPLPSKAKARPEVQTQSALSAPDSASDARATEDASHTKDAGATFRKSA